MIKKEFHRYPNKNWTNPNLGDQMVGQPGCYLPPPLQPHLFPALELAQLPARITAGTSCELDQWKVGQSMTHEWSQIITYLLSTSTSCASLCQFGNHKNLWFSLFGFPWSHPNLVDPNDPLSTSISSKMPSNFSSASVIPTPNPFFKAKRIIYKSCQKISISSTNHPLIAYITCISISCRIPCINSPSRSSRPSGKHTKSYGKWPIE